MNRESLSALFDGECKGAELDRLMVELDRDPALRSQWSRLCVARQAVHGKARPHDEALTRNIMAAIARDTQPARRLPRMPSWIWLRPVTAYAMAAAIGAFAVFSFMPKSTGDMQSPLTVVEVAATDPAPAADPFVADHQKVRGTQRFGGSLQRAVYSPSGASY